MRSVSVINRTHFSLTRSTFVPGFMTVDKKDSRDRGAQPREPKRAGARTAEDREAGSPRVRTLISGWPAVKGLPSGHVTGPP